MKIITTVLIALVLFLGSMANAHAFWGKKVSHLEAIRTSVNVQKLRPASHSEKRCTELYTTAKRLGAARADYYYKGKIDLYRALIPGEAATMPIDEMVNRANAWRVTDDNYRTVPEDFGAYIYAICMGYH